MTRTFEMRPYGGKLSSPFARVHVIVDIDRLEPARRFSRPQRRIEMQIAVVTSRAITDVEIVVGIGRINLPLGADGATDWRKIGNRRITRIDAGIPAVHIPQTEFTGACNHRLERLGT